MFSAFLEQIWIARYVIASGLAMTVSISLLAIVAGSLAGVVVGLLEAGVLRHGQGVDHPRVSEILCERHTMMLPRSMYATQEEDAGGHAGH